VTLYTRYSRALTFENVYQGARGVLKRGCQVHLTRSARRLPLVYAWVLIEEQLGCVDTARSLLRQTLGGGGTSDLETVLALISLERRAGDVPSCVAVYREYIDAYSKAGERDEAVHLTLGLASFLSEVCVCVCVCVCV